MPLLLVKLSLLTLLQRAEEKTAAMLALQTELDQLREDHAHERDLAARRARQDEEELQILRDRCERLEAEGGGGDVSRSLPSTSCNLPHCFHRWTLKFSINSDQTWRAS